MSTFPTIMGHFIFSNWFFSPICVIRPSYKLFLTFIFAFQPYSYFFLNNFHVIKTCLELTWNLFMIKTNKLQFSINIQRERRKITMNLCYESFPCSLKDCYTTTSLLKCPICYTYVVTITSFDVDTVGLKSIHTSIFVNLCL